jgi:hypothetical protein
MESSSPSQVLVVADRVGVGCIARAVGGRTGLSSRFAVGTGAEAAAAVSIRSETAAAVSLQSLVRGLLVRRQVWQIRPSRLTALRAYIAEELQRERDVLYASACQDDSALPSLHPSRVDMLGWAFSSLIGVMRLHTSEVLAGVRYFDRVLALSGVLSYDALELLLVACLWVASKSFDRDGPLPLVSDVERALRQCARYQTAPNWRTFRADLLRLERRILHVMRWRMHVVTPDVVAAALLEFLPCPGVARGRLWSRVRHLLLEQLPIPELLSYRSAILAAGAVLVALFRSPTDAFEVEQELDRWCLTDRTALIRCVRVLQTRLNLRALLSDDSVDECEQPPSKRHRVLMLPTH